MTDTSEDLPADGKPISATSARDFNSSTMSTRLARLAEQREAGRLAAG
jgi:hypothetical protein